MKHTRLLLLAMALALSLTACGGSQSEEESQTPINPAKEITEYSEPDAYVRPRIYALEADSPEEAYAKVLWFAYQYGRLPGEDSGQFDYFYSIGAAANSYAIYDVDGDSRDELLLSFPSTTYVWEYRDSVLYEELCALTYGLIFYDNNVVHVDWSHSQGFAGENFWPYFLYAYNGETDLYDCIGDVDAWDINCYADGFPADIDQDGDGMVYYLLRNGEDRYTGDYDEYGHPIKKPPVDGPEYEAWRDSVLRDAQPMDIPWQALSRGHIAALGFPEPEMPDLTKIFKG